MALSNAYSSYTIIDLTDGIIWKGELNSPPENPGISWAYYDITKRQSYIYDGEQWQIFAQDGINGINLFKKNQLEVKGIINPPVFENTHSITIDSISKWHTTYIKNKETLPPGTYTINATTSVSNRSKVFGLASTVILPGIVDIKNDYYTEQFGMDAYWGLNLTFPLTFTLNESANISIILWADENGDNTTQTITDLKLEVGAIDTPWSAAPADLIANETQEYYHSTSRNELQEGSWNVIAPSAEAGKYIWKRTKISYMDGSKKYMPDENGYCDAGFDGSPAINYSFSMSPKTWNKTEQEIITPEATIIKTVGGVVEELDENEYQIKIGEIVWSELLNQEIDSTTTFDLWVNNIKVASDTVTAVEDGVDAAPVYRIDTLSIIAPITDENGNFPNSNLNESDSQNITFTVYKDNQIFDQSITRVLGESATEITATGYYMRIMSAAYTNCSFSAPADLANTFIAIIKGSDAVDLEPKNEFIITLKFFYAEVKEDGSIQRTTIIEAPITCSKNMQGPKGNDIKDLILSSTATEVQVSLDNSGNKVYSPESITFTAEPKNMTGTYQWHNGSTGSSLTINHDQNTTFPYTATITFIETSTGQEYTKSITVTCPRQIVSVEQNSQTYTYYASSDNSYTPPYLVDGNHNVLNTNQPGYPANGTNRDDSGNATWVWVTQQIGTYYTYTYSDNTTQDTEIQYSLWSEWELVGDNAEDVKAFNTLTNNGQFEGHFYGVYVRLGAGGKFEFTTSDDTNVKYLIQPTDSDIQNNDLYIALNEQGKYVRVNENIEGAENVMSRIMIVDGQEKTLDLLAALDYYVNATMIQTGSLLVGTQEKPILMAGFDNNTVKVAGFDVSDHSLENATDGYVYLGTDAIKLGGNNDNPVFSVNNSGEMQMTKGFIKLGEKIDEYHPFEVNDQGEMHSISGSIGGWNITNSGLMYENVLPEGTLSEIKYYFAAVPRDTADELLPTFDYITTPIGIDFIDNLAIKTEMIYNNGIKAIIYEQYSAGFSTGDIIKSYCIAYNETDSSSHEKPTYNENTGQWDVGEYYWKFSLWDNIYGCLMVAVETSSDGLYIKPVYDAKKFPKNTNAIVAKTGLFVSEATFPSLFNSNLSKLRFASGYIPNNSIPLFAVLEDGSTYLSGLSVEVIHHQKEKLHFGTAAMYSGTENQYYTGITLYTPGHSLTKTTVTEGGFYIGYDGANFKTLYIDGRRIYIDNDGYLKGV